MTEIQEIVKGDGRSFRWLAREVGYSYPYLLSVVSRRAVASPKIMKAVAGALGRSPEELFSGDGFAR